MTEESTLELSPDRVRELLQAEPDSLRAYLEGFHPSDIADVVESLNADERQAVVALLGDEVAAETLAEMEESEHPEELLVADPARIAELVQQLSDDDAADIIGDLPPDTQRQVLAALPIAEAGELRELLAYEEESAGGVMTTDFVSVLESTSVGDAFGEIRRQGRDVDDFYSVFIVDGAGRLRGTISLQDLLLAPTETPVSEITEPPVAVVPATMDQEEVARVMSRYNLVSIPVVDPHERLVGRVTFDDVMDVMEAETTEDILKLAGLTPEEEIRGGVGEAIRSRLPWLYVNMLTVSIAAGVVFYYQATIEAAVLLAVFMPVIAALGGNAGTQALAVTVRRLALSTDRSKEWGVVFKEIGVGLINGAAIGLVAAAVGSLVPDGGVLFGLVVMLATWFNVAVAGFAGAFVPVLLERIGVDPAVASSVFVTAFTDLCGFFFLLGLAEWILHPRL